MAVQSASPIYLEPETRTAVFADVGAALDFACHTPERWHVKAVVHLGARTVGINIVHELRRARAARRRAQNRGLPATLDARSWLDVLIAHEGRCRYCGQPFETLDHIIPLAAGGGSTPDNVAPACRACNEEKADQILV